MSFSKIIASHLSCRVLIVGGGAGGCAVASKFQKYLKCPQKELILIEPSDTHYYQPLFTFVGAGVYDLERSHRPMAKVLPSHVKWLQDEVVNFLPQNNTVKTKNGTTVTYDCLLIATGLETKYDKVPGLLDALHTPNGGVCSNYSPKYVQLTAKCLHQFRGGNAIFTFPEGPVKCPGAPQKICYLTDHFLRMKGIRSNANLIYNTALPVIFVVKKYADALWVVCKKRGINVNTDMCLREVQPGRKVAIFEHKGDVTKTMDYEYSILHVTPPMETGYSLSSCVELVNEVGLVDVDKGSLQSNRFSNVFAIGDCSSTPNSKTAAAVAAQSKIVFQNMVAFISGKEITKCYNGYTSCPLLTSYDKCILAEFDYNLEPFETFPFRQDKEMRSMFFLTKHFIPKLYWDLLLKGRWNGPSFLKTILHAGIDK